MKRVLSIILLAALVIATMGFTVLAEEEFDPQAKKGDPVAGLDGPGHGRPAVHPGDGQAAV